MAPYLQLFWLIFELPSLRLLGGWLRSVDLNDSNVNSSFRDGLLISRLQLTIFVQLRFFCKDILKVIDIKEI